MNSFQSDRRKQSSTPQSLYSPSTSTTSTVPAWPSAPVAEHGTPAQQGIVGPGYSLANLSIHAPAPQPTAMQLQQSERADSQGQPELVPEGQQENRTGLPDALKAGVERLSGYSLDTIRVHYNSPSPAEVQALAYTQGTEIHVGPGQEQHLAHEAWHVVQQMQGRVQPTMQVKGVAINDDAGLEREADVMGGKATNAGSTVQADQERNESPSVIRLPMLQAYTRQMAGTIQRVWVYNDKDWSNDEKSKIEKLKKDDPLAALSAIAKVYYPANFLDLEAYLSGMFQSGSNEQVKKEIDAFLLLALTSEGYWTIPGMIDSLVQIGVDAALPGDDHTDEDREDAPLQVPEPDELNIKELDLEQLWRSFQLMLPADKVQDLSEKQLLSAFEQWVKSGVMTRSQFNALFGVQKGAQQENTPMQMKRTPGDSYQAGYMSSTHGQFTNVTYTRDSPHANIDFTNPKVKKQWANPVDASSLVQLTQGTHTKNKGLMTSGHLVHIPSASRSQHFAIANRIKKNGATGSPAGWTWHHLTAKYMMVLVDRKVHSKHGHNGGVFLW